MTSENTESVQEADVIANSETTQAESVEEPAVVEEESGFLNENYTVEEEAAEPEGTPLSDEVIEENAAVSDE